MSRPRAVFVTPVEPASSGNGLAMRMGVFLTALSRFADVDVIVVAASENSTQIGRHSLVRSLGARLHVVPTRGLVDTHFSLLARIQDRAARLAAFKAYGRPSLASGMSPPVLHQIGKIIDACRPDLIHVGRSYLSEIVTVAPSRAIATLDLDEDDFTNFTSQARRARAEEFWFESEWLMQEGRACDMLVESFGPTFHNLFVASDREARLLSQRHPLLGFTTIENAVEFPRLTASRNDDATLLFVGSLGYAPNCEGLLWLVGDILPRLTAMRGGGWRLLIAGAQPSENIRRLARSPYVRLLGHVDDLPRLYRKATLALAPLRSGGGTRIKVIEAAAQGVASVFTHAASEGLDWPTGAGGWRADSSADFAAACHTGLSDPGERRRRAAAARRWLASRHTRDRVVFRLAATLKSSLSLR